MDISNKKGSLPATIVADNEFLNINSEGIDSIFAELFSLVNLDSNEQNSVSNNNLDIHNMKGNELSSENFVNDDDKNSILAAKSLISIFFDDNEFTSNVKEKIKENISDKKNIKNDPWIQPFQIPQKHISILKKHLKENINNSLSSNLKNTSKFLKPQNLGMSEKFFQSKKGTKISNEIERNLSVIHKANQFFSGKNEINVNKKKSMSKTKPLKIHVEYLSNEKSDLALEKVIVKKINKPISKQPLENKTGLSQNIENVSSSRNNSIETILPKNLNQGNLHDKQFLDLLESGWGEKFIKSLKVSLENGKTKIDFFVKPKNLGKLKVEVNVEDGKTNIKINSENKTVAHILNENQSRLNELLNKETHKVDDYTESSYHNNSNENNQNQKDKKKQTVLSEKKIEEIDTKNAEKKLQKKNLHKVDINA